MAKKKSAQVSGQLYQFKITLKNIKPVIWRRIQIYDCRLSQFHNLVQTVMGWCGGHMHQFVIDGEYYGELAPDIDFEVLDEHKYWLHDFISTSTSKKKFLYEYDFGDGWLHEIMFEGFKQPDPQAAYPICLKGANACPPEDIGGPWGYMEFVKAITNPKHERHEEFLEWSGSFDPSKFNAADISKLIADSPRA